MALTDRYVTSSGSDTYANSTSSSTPMSLTTAFANAAAGDRINIQVGTYTRTATDTPANSGTATSPIIYRGYSSTIGDGNLGRTNGNREIITTNMPSIAYNSTFRLNSTGTFVIFESINFSGSVGNNLVAVTTDSVVKSCKIVNNGGSGSGALSIAATGAIAFDNDAELTSGSATTAGIVGSTAACRIIANRVKATGTANGISCGGTASVIGNVVYAAAGIGIAMTSSAGSPTIYGNTVVGGSGDAINIVTGTTHLQCIVGNMLTDNTGDGIDMVSTGNSGFAAYNRTRDNANGVNNGGDWLTATTYAHVTTDTGGPETDYVNSGSNDYRLIPASPARGASWPAYSSMGALQRQEISSSFTFGG